jgi:pantoate kinase
MTPEGKVKAKIKKILTGMGAYYAMPMGTGFGNSGVPDFLVCYQGRFFGIEAKANGGKATALQLKNLDQIDNAGGYGFVVDESNIDGLELHIKELIK